MAANGHVDLAGHLGENMRQLREARGLTQAQIARLAQLPRATWANVESGGGNPTLAVISRIASALQVSLEELVARPRASARYVPRDQLTSKTRGAVTMRRLLPEPIPGMEMDRMEFPRGARMTGVPHTPGTREYLTCERGVIELWAEDCLMVEVLTDEMQAEYLDTITIDNWRRMLAARDAAMRAAA